MEHLTDKEFWEHYWNARNDIFRVVPSNYIFSDIFEKIVSQKHPQTAIEIGGFPGLHSVYLYKYFKISPTLLDLIVIPSVVEKICVINNIPPSAVKWHEADFFSFQPEQQFDLVFSNGFIEHFSDTASVIKQHLLYLKKGGTLLITLPNFKSINGLFQKIFDRENYDKHNLQCMDKKFLRNICEQLKLGEVEVSYYGYFSIWLEEKARKNWFARLCRTLVFYPLKVFFRLTRWNVRYFAPYLVIKATS